MIHKQGISHRGFRTGDFAKRFVVFGMVVALFLNIIIAPLSSALAPVISEYIASGATVQPASQTASVVSTAAEGTLTATTHVGGVLTDIWNNFMNFISGIQQFLDGLFQISTCISNWSNSGGGVLIAMGACIILMPAQFILGMVYELLAKMYTVNIFIDPSSEHLIHKFWDEFVKYANILFAILFLIIIIATAFAGNSSVAANISIKKTLPRLIVVAIAINVSFYACAALADLSNIVGKGIITMVDETTRNALRTDPDRPVDDPDLAGDLTKIDLANPENTTPENNTSTVNTAASAANDAFAIASTSNPQGMAVWMVILVVVMVIVVIFYVGFNIIFSVIRNILLMACVMISPFAFLALLLPNTQKYFTKWLNTFGRMLMILPVLMLVIGISKVAVWLIIGMSIEPVQMKLVMVMAAMISPLFFMKKIVKSSNAVIGKVSEGIGKVVKAAVTVAAIAATGGAAAAAGGGSLLAGAGQSLLKAGVSKIPGGGGLAEAGTGAVKSNARRGKGFGQKIGSFLNRQDKTAENEKSIQGFQAQGFSRPQAEEMHAKKERRDIAEAEVKSMTAQEKQDVLSNPAAHSNETVTAVLRDPTVKLDKSAAKETLKQAAQSDDSDLHAAAAQRMEEEGTYGKDAIESMRQGGDNNGRGWDAAGQQAAQEDKVSELSEEDYRNASVSKRIAWSDIANSTSRADVKDNFQEVEVRVARSDKTGKLSAQEHADLKVKHATEIEARAQQEAHENAAREKAAGNKNYT
jgi:hypothetical protein